MAGTRKSTRARTAPRYLRDYVTDEMSASEIRRMPQDGLEDNGVGGMLDDDICDRTNDAGQTGCQLPAGGMQDSRQNETGAIANAVFHAVWDELRRDDVGAVKTAEVLAKLAVMLLNN